MITVKQKILRAQPNESHCEVWWPTNNTKSIASEVRMSFLLLSRRHHNKQKFLRAHSNKSHCLVWLPNNTKSKWRCCSNIIFAAISRHHDKHGKDFNSWPEQGHNVWYGYQIIQNLNFVAITILFLTPWQHPWYICMPEKYSVAVFWGVFLSHCLEKQACNSECGCVRL